MKLPMHALLPLAALALLPLGAAPSATPPETPAGTCAQPAYRGLDFTLGTWKVTGPEGESYGTSTISRGLYGCLVFERWQAGSLSGRNVDAYDAEDGQWHRFFVTSAGKVHSFSGTIADGALRYEGTSVDGTAHVLNRFSIRSTASDAMTQRWEQSADGGKTWRTVYEAVYRRTSPG